MRELVGQGKPFYSSLDKAAGLLRRKVGTGSEFLKELMSIPGVKQAEIAERGLGELLNAPKMTHEQFMAALGTKPTPVIHEKVFANKILKNPGSEPDPHHEKWTLPGGENYREMLIKAPEPQDYTEEIMGAHAKLRRIPYHGRTPEQESQVSALAKKLREMEKKQEEQPKVFSGVPQHFGGEPGVLASLRLKDRTVPGDMGYTLVNKKSGNKSQHYNTIEEAQAALQGMPESMRPSLDIQPSRGPEKKLLHLEELQSDWHQKGRERGYMDSAEAQEVENKSKQIAKQRRELVNELTKHEHEHGFISSEMQSRWNAFREIEDEHKEKTREVNTRVPNAPFKKNWEEMALKRLIHHAAENGYHGVVVTPGAEQADRYGLAKHVGMVSYHPGEKRFQAFKPNRETVVNEKDASPDRVAELIGKEAAQRLLAAPKVGDHHFLEGEDLNIGGEGMKGFYDKKVPNILNSIGKKYGVKTELGGHQIKINEGMLEPNPNGGYTQTPPETKPAHYFPITEEMRQDVKKNGIPLYKSGGTVAT